MKHKSPNVWLVTAALLLSFAEAGIAQVGLQQMPSSPNGSFSSAAMGAHQPNVAAEMRSSGLIAVPQDFTKLALAPGFLMQLRVLDDPDFGGSFRVDQQGDIALPILGIIHVAGETVSAARLQIQKKLLDDQILKNPDVNLTVLEYTAPEVTIVGEVVSPGKYPLLAPRTLVDVLALAGGTTLTAGNEVQITRGSAEGRTGPGALFSRHRSKSGQGSNREFRRHCAGKEGGHRVRAGSGDPTWRVCDAGRRYAQRTASHRAG